MGNLLENAAKVSQVVVKCGGELYHLEKARLDYGDDKVINELKDHFTKSENLSPADSSIRAGKFLNDIDSLKTGGFGFKEMREVMKEDNTVLCDAFLIA